MYLARLHNRLALIAAALLLAAGTAGAAEDKDALRDEALALNRLTGNDPIKAKIKALITDAKGTKKLLGVAVGMAREKDQPFNYNAAHILATAAFRLKEHDTAEIFYRLCRELALKLQSGKKLSEAYAGLIDLYYETKKFGECEKLCKEFVEDVEGDEEVQRMKVIVLRRMIQALARQGKIDEANKLIDRLLKVDKDNVLTLETRGWVQREAGQLDDAAKTYEDVLDRVQKNENIDKQVRDDYAKDIRYLLSGVYVDAKQIDKAAEHLQTLLKLEPENPTYNNDLGYIWADHDMKLDESEKLIRKALDEDRKQRRKDNPDITPEEDKDNGAYLDSLGWVLFKKKDYKEAKKHLLQAVQDKDSQHIEIYDHLGDVHAALGEKAEAVKAWKKGLEIAGDSKREKEKKSAVEKKLKESQ